MADDGQANPGAFDLVLAVSGRAYLGFTHYWGKSRNSNWIIKRQTARKRQVGTQSTPAEIAYVAAVETTQLILQDAATMVRNNHLLFASATALAIKKIAEDNVEGEQMLQGIEKSMPNSQDYLAKTANICVQILADFKTLL